MIKVGIIGAGGKMGKEVARTILNDPETKLCAALDISAHGIDVGKLLEMPELGVIATSSMDEFLANELDVVVDFTRAEAVKTNIPKVLQKRVRAVIGTTGLDQELVSSLEKLAVENDTAVFIAPNFAIGGVLMMKFAKEAVKYLPDVEVIELHHDKKVDAPSGTAVKTLEDMAENREPKRQGMADEYEKIPGARGGEYQGMHVHSVRLPGMVAHQEVIFGGLGQILTIRHDSFSRESFMPGVLIAVKRIGEYKGLVYGLDKLL